jgi:hypothetical protein
MVPPFASILAMLHPKVVLEPGSDIDEAKALHERRITSA